MSLMIHESNMLLLNSFVDGGVVSSIMSLKSSASSPNLPAVATVSKVDQATVERGLSGAGSNGDLANDAALGGGGSRPSSGSRAGTAKRRDKVSL